MQVQLLFDNYLFAGLTISKLCMRFSLFVVLDYLINRESAFRHESSWWFVYALVENFYYDIESYVLLKKIPLLYG